MHNILYDFIINAQVLSSRCKNMSYCRVDLFEGKLDRLRFIRWTLLLVFESESINLMIVLTVFSSQLSVEVNSTQ